MALPFVFANVTELDTPQLDSNFNALGALTVIPCTAAGTNAIVLTPAANTPTVSAYSNEAPVFGFRAAATTTASPVTISVGGIGNKNVYKANGFSLIGASDFVIGGIYFVAYDATLNSSAGGFVVLNPGATAATAGATQGTFRQLVVTNTTAGTPNTQCIVTAGALSVSDGASNFTSLTSVNVTISSGSSGANGLDTGGVAANTWYSIWVIYNPSTVTTAGLMSTNFTIPALPSGFSQYAFVGAMRTNASSQFHRILQKGRKAQYVIGATVTTAMPLISSGTVGAVNVPTWVSASVVNFVPTAVASRIAGALGNQSASNSLAIVAPNNAYGAFNSATNQPPVVALTPAVTNAVVPFEFELESTAIFWASNTNWNLYCLGWELNL